MAKLVTDAKINMRITKAKLNLIDEAAEMSGRNRTDFFIEAATSRAQDLFLNRKHFALNEDEWSQINDILDKPPAISKNLAKLLSKQPLWEKDSM